MTYHKSQVWRAIILLLIVGLFIYTPVADAISSAQREVWSSGAYYFNTESTTCGAPGSVSLLGSDNPEKAYNYFIGRGLSPDQAAGIVGNLMQESGVNPLSSSGGGGTIGIAQWEGSRDDALRAFAQKQGKPYTDLGVQLDYLWSELTGAYSSVLDRLKNASDYITATNIFVGPDVWPSGEPADPYYEGRRQGGFENPGTPFIARRISNAKEVLNTYGDGVSTGQATDTGSGCGGGTFTNGFPFYSQCDAKWGDKSYAGNTMCEAGCGPSSMAMIITALTGKQVTPDEVAAYYTQNGFSGSFGTTWNAAPAAAQHWNLQSTALGTSVSKISQAIQGGSLVIMAGKGSLPFTSGGHFVVVRAVTPDGKWLLGDPATSTGHSNTQEWDPSTVIAGVISNGAASSVYAISK